GGIDRRGLGEPGPGPDGTLMRSVRLSPRVAADRRVGRQREGHTVPAERVPPDNGYRVRQPAAVVTLDRQCAVPAVGGAKVGLRTALRLEEKQIAHLLHAAWAVTA